MLCITLLKIAIMNISTTLLLIVHIDAAIILTTLLIIVHIDAAMILLESILMKYKIIGGVIIYQLEKQCGRFWVSISLRRNQASHQYPSNYPPSTEFKNTDKMTILIHCPHSITTSFVRLVLLFNMASVWTSTTLLSFNTSRFSDSRNSIQKNYGHQTIILNNKTCMEARHFTFRTVSTLCKDSRCILIARRSILPSRYTTKTFSLFVH